MKKIFLWVLISCAAAIAHGAERLDTAVWVKRPIPLVLPIAVGITVYLPEGDWAAAIPGSVAQKVTRYPAHNTVFLQAREEFEPVLMQFKDIDSEQIISVLLSASASAPVVDLRIIDGTRDDPNEGLSGKRSDVFKALTRHAALSLYAPDRLVPFNRLIKTFPVERAGLKVFVRVQDPDRGVGCTDTGQLTGRPIAAWRSGGKAYVTAVRIENVGTQEIAIDPRGCHIKGDFVTATPQHSLVRPKYANWCYDPGAATVGEKATCKKTYEEVTTLYLTSTRPFWEVVSDENMRVVSDESE